jgi:hypothetical protein
MTALILGYGFIHAGMFGLLIGLAAENLRTWRHWAFLWLLSMVWPVIIGWKVFCDKEPRP